MSSSLCLMMRVQGPDQLYSTVPAVCKLMSSSTKRKMISGAIRTSPRSSPRRFMLIMWTLQGSSSTVVALYAFVSDLPSVIVRATGVYVTRALAGMQDKCEKSDVYIIF